MSDKFKELLDATHTWPCTYNMKVVVPATKLEELQSKFKGFELKKRESKSGKYVSCTLSTVAMNADQVLGYYAIAGKIEGAILL